MRYVFRRNSSVGAMDAESDERFLRDCFLDTGDLDSLEDCQDPKRIVVGRVGAGKSALLSRLLESHSNAVEIRAEQLSLSYVANSDIIQFFESAGVKLDLFYQLLWRHVFVIELLRKRYRISANDPWGFLDQLRDLFQRDQAKKRAVDYLKQWNDHFWQDTETRVKEFTSKLETKLSSAIDAKAYGITLNASGAQTLSDEIKSEVLHKAQSVVNDNQVRELSEIITLLADEIFTDPQNRFYLVIDRLDESWVDDRIRFKLIRALIETVRAFQRVRSVKAVVAIREDLLRTVFEETRDAGFQEEKFEGLFLRLRWSKAQLKQMIDLRIEKLIKEQYTQRKVTFEDIFRGSVRGESAIDYLLSRTLLRPRDVIAFVNCCIELCEGKEFVTPSTVQDAERKYSIGRLRSLKDEWISHYASLEACTEILRGRNTHFRYSEITETHLQECIQEHWIQIPESDPVGLAANEYLNNKRSANSLLIQILKVLYTTSIVGVKPEATERVSWSYLDDRGISDGQYKKSSSINVHPMLWRALDVVLPVRADRRRHTTEDRPRDDHKGTKQRFRS
ncbi:putative aTPase involved in DNA repair [Burkholderia pseudomallei]|nr:putative aTPase involved in DNA repair [Burkholderia pseudomallei NCTC 13179]ARL03126.1 ATPase [Burkholderia pseudomallei]KGC66176.1 putative aTPase involved in DNA repair [Burkholderia pseudomallei]KGD33523.1 putative aTPase involved in DNA repair [Burkholderia pseudomallei]OSP93776.1 ATPase [Burkholderia pseudomallei]